MRKVCLGGEMPELLLLLLADSQKLLQGVLKIARFSIIRGGIWIHRVVCVVGIEVEVIAVELVGRSVEVAAVLVEISCHFGNINDRLF